MNTTKIIPISIALFIFTIFIFCSVFSYPSSDWIIIDSLNKNNIFFFYNKYLVEQYPVITNEGRYHILNGLHLNISLIFTHLETKRIFIGFLQGLIYILFCYILYLNTNKNKNILSKFLFFVFIFSQQFLYTFFHPALEESLFCLFIAAIFCLINKNSTNNNFLILSILLILLIFAKITSLIIILSYLISAIYFSYFNKNKFTNKYISIFFISIFLWLFLIILTNSYITTEDKTRFIEFNKYILLYIKSDPFLFLIIGFILLKIYSKNDITQYKNIQSIHFFNAGIIYFICLIMTGKHSQYHILPVYTCVLPLFFICLNSFNKYYKFSFIEIILSAIILIIYLYSNIKIILGLNLLIFIFLNYSLYKKYKISKILVYFNIFTLLIFLIFKNLSHNFTQLLFCSNILFFIYQCENLKSIYKITINFLFLYFATGLLFGGFLTTYYHLNNQLSIIEIANLIQNDSLIKNKNKIILFDLKDAKPEDVVNHSYILAKSIGSVYGDFVRIMPVQCQSIPEKYDSIRNEQSFVYARDFHNVVIACHAEPFNKVSNYSYFNVNATYNKLFDPILSKLSIYNPQQLIVTHY